MKSLPLISVIIPIYCVEKFLRQCIDSVIGQTYTNLEIILIDDGSPDNCGKICDEYAAKDARIHVVHLTNKGISTARNVGLEMAHGEYLTFVDSDDYIEPDMYEYLYHLITKDHAAISMCNTCQDKVHPNRAQIEKPYLLIPALDIFQFKGWVYLWNKLYRRDFISSLRFNVTTTYGEDGLFIFELAKTNAPIALGNQAKYHYRQNHNSSALTKTFLPTHLNKIILTEECLAYAKQHHLNVYYRRCYAAQLLHASKWLKQIALSSIQDPASVKFLTGYIKQRLPKFLLTKTIPCHYKLFALTACIHFNLARKLLLFYHVKFEKDK